MRQTVINLTRLGDLLQTQPVINGLKEQGHEVGLVCLENFASAIKLMQGVDYASALPGAAVLAGLHSDWRNCLNGLHLWLRAERLKFPAETVLNLTPTISARIFSRLLDAKDEPGDCGPNGFGLDVYGFCRDGNAWSTYVQAVTMNRGCSPFNLVDGFRQMAGVGGCAPTYELREPNAEVCAEMRKTLSKMAREAGFQPPYSYIGFQLGASAEVRRWPSSYFASLGKLIFTKTGLIPILFGSAEEEALTAKYRQENAPGLNLCGKTDLEQLAAALTCCKMLISNDTGTMHLAAGLNIPILGIFLATAQPWDTGPYQENMCSLEPRLDCHPCGFNRECPHKQICKGHISPEAVAELAISRLESGTWQPGECSRTEARIWLSFRDEQQFMNLRSLSGDEASDRTIWIRLQRDFYRQFLDAMRGQAVALPAAIPGESVRLSTSFKERILPMLEIINSLLLLAGAQLTLLESRPRKTTHAFLISCKRISEQIGAVPELMPLYHLWSSFLQNHPPEWKIYMQTVLNTLRAHLTNLAIHIAS